MSTSELNGAQPELKTPAEDISGRRHTYDVRKLPIDPATSKPLPPTPHPGYYPGYHVLSQQSFWDEATRNVVLERVNNIPPIRFFTEQELPLITAIVERILPQDDRDKEYRIPIVPFIDKKLAEGIIDGYRFEKLPPQEKLYRLLLKGVQAIAQEKYGDSFIHLGQHDQDEILKSLHDNRPQAGQEYWEQVGDLRHMWVQLVTDVVTVYYAHPYSWDEIGYGGPAYPRGYMRLERGEPEPWEADERRYEWLAPPESLSDRYEPVGLEPNEEAQFHGAPGQSGTH